MEYNKVMVSVIIPVYGCGDCIQRCVDSVLNQSYSNIECIVVDDNGLGTDNQRLVESILCKYKSDSRFKYVCHNTNINGSAARNTGVGHSNGEYIILLDDDDELYPYFIQSQLSCLDNMPPIKGLVYCSFEVWKGKEKLRTNYARKSGNLLFETLIHDIEIPTSSWLIRKSAYLSINGFDESFKRHQDWEFITRFSDKYHIVANNDICFKRHLEFRNSPRDYEQRMAYRNYYLEKMMPFIQKFNKNEQKAIYVYNRLDVSLHFIKQIGLYKFIKDVISSGSMYYSIKFLFNRIKTYSKYGIVSK